MDDLIAIFTSCGDIATLSQCGFLTDFTHPKVAAAQLGSDLDEIELASFARFWRLIYHSMRACVLGNLRYTNGFPCVMAGMLHSTPSRAAERLAYFRDCEAAYQAALARTESTIKAIVTRSPMQSTPVRWAAKFAKSGDFKDPIYSIVQIN